MVKVLLIGFLLLVVIGVISGIYVYYGPAFDSKNSYVTCNDGKQIFLKETNVNLYSSYINSSQDYALKQACYSEITDTKTSEQKQLGNRQYTLTTISDNYTFTEVEKWNWLAIIGWSLLTIVSALLVLEIVRRILYYILLGAFRPKQN